MAVFNSTYTGHAPAGWNADPSPFEYGQADVLVSEQPLVSIICFCKNRVSFIPRSVESVLNQTYRNIELVVQDGASTDGTLELLKSYAARDPRIKIVSEPDSGPAEAYWKVLHRCTGDYIGTCLSDEELIPDAVEKAVGWFASAPTVGAFTCDGHTTDADGNITGEFKAGDFDFVAYLFNKYCPFWPGSFFRRKALLDVGLDRPGWNIGCLEFEIWCRLARDHEVRYVPEPISKYAVHPGQLSNTPANFYEHIENRLKLIENLFSAEGFFGGDKHHQQVIGHVLEFSLYSDHWFRELESKINHLSQFEFHARAHKLVEHEKEFTRRIDELKAAIVALHEHNIFVADQRVWKLPRETRRRLKIADLWPAWQATTGLPHDAQPTERALRRKLWILRTLTEQVFARLPQPLKKAIRLTHRLGLTEDATPAFKAFAEAQRARRLAQMYDTTARIHDSRGQTTQALALWQRAEPLNDRDVDSLACQAILKLPEATYDSIREFQQRWADRHIPARSNTSAIEFMPYQEGHKIRVGYHCSFMDADTIRFLMRRPIRAHDRAKFEVFGYAPMDLPDDLHTAFDVVRKTSSMSDDAFLKQVRNDRIDVLVELSGFSPGHRFGAMAERCAPVQISYLNHFATSRVRNVDYILSDEVCTPVTSNAQSTFSETLFRLPECLLCYDYTDDNCPPVSDPPSLAGGSVTFGCFGSGGKINTQLIELWSELMRRTPNSTMLIQNPQLEPLDNRRYMADRFARFGIPPERLKLRPGTDRAGVLKAYAEVDVSLDTWPYCGGNTVAESLWLGVPVVTLRGSRFSSRYGASLLQAAGCSDLIAGTFEEYLDVAARLAQNPARLLSLRKTLRDSYSKGGLNDSASFARKLEQAYLQMMQAHAKTVGVTRTV